jgi:undecaprenyl-diphosphatase
LLVVPLLIFVVLAVLVSDNAKPGPDARLLTFLNENVEGSALAGAAELLVGACLWLGLVILPAIIGALSFRRRFTPALFLASVTVGSFLVERVLKHTVERAAINHGQGYSFPSGSAMISFAVIAAVVLLSGDRRRAWACAAGAGLVFAYGLSIVSLGWHYPSDVVAGWCLAVALVVTLWLVLGRPTLGRAPRESFPGVRPSTAAGLVDFTKIT